MQTSIHWLTRNRVELAVAVVLSLGILILPNTAVIAATATEAIDDILPGEPNDPSDFRFESFDAAYELTRGEDGRSRLATTETLVAGFPDIDQNTGIVRRIPNYYRGHATGVRVLSVSNANGDAIEYSVDPRGDYTSVRITDGSFLYGETTFVVRYEQSDVTARYDNDEFYWDVNGVDWSQPFGIVRATLTMDETLAAQLTGDVACYTGEQGETASDCEISTRRDGESSAVTAQSGSSGGYTGLDERENLSVSVGFAPGTFASAPESAAARIASAWYWLGGLATLGPLVSALGLLLLALVWKWRERRAVRMPGPVIAEYAPPRGITVAQAAYLIDTRAAKKRAFAADTVDQVVQKKLILERTGSDYTVRLAQKGGSKVTDLLTTRSAYRAVLTKGPQAGTSGGVVVRKANYPLRLAFGGLRGRVITSVADSFTATPRSGPARVVLGVAALLAAVIALFVYGPRTGGNAAANLVLLWGAIAIAAPVLTLTVLLRLRLPTANTVRIRRHLEGLRVYIRLAEQDRLRILQSPDNAEFAVVGEKEIVALNERLLGYAVLFGLEEEWSAQIGVASAAAPSAAVDITSSVAIGALVAAVSSTTPHSPPSSSRGSNDSSSSDSGGSYDGGGGYSGSSGGSDGGGSSGGGGGGGGGDGI